jgi:hemerythrin
MNASDRLPHTPEIHFFVVDWRDGFEIGVADIDGEHRRLFMLVKALELGTVDRTLDELLDYVVAHFAHEEELMEATAYPGMRQHIALHQHFSLQLARMVGGDSEWDADRVHNLRKFLNKWLVGHILTHDLRFGRWYQEQGKWPAARPVQQRPSPRPVKVGLVGRLLGRR